jgi:hypothetical protein
MFWMDLELLRATRVVLQTTPYLAIRVVVYAALWVAVVLYLAVLGVIGWTFGSFAFWALVVASAVLTVLVGVGNLLGIYMFYLLRAGHLAILSELLTEGALPLGVSQPGWGADQVARHFRELRVLALVHRRTSQAAAAFHRDLVDVTTAVPLPGMEAASTLAARAAALSLPYLTETLLARIFRTRNLNPFDGARAALVRYAQRWQPVLRAAVALTVVGWAFATLAAVLSMAPLGVVGAYYDNESVRFVLFLMAVLFGVCAKWALFDPVAQASLMRIFMETPGDGDEEWEARLEGASPAFRDLQVRAAAREREMQGEAAESA